MLAMKSVYVRVTGVVRDCQGTDVLRGEFLDIFSRLSPVHVTDSF